MDPRQQNYKNAGVHTLFAGCDEQEHKRQTERQTKQAHPQFSKMTSDQKQRKLNKLKSKMQQSQGNGFCTNVDEDMFIQNNDQQQQQKPQFMLLVKQHEEVSIDLEGYIDQQYAQGHQIKYFPKENDYGPTEHKLLVEPDPRRLTHLITQMNFRIGEGNGTAFYKVGVEDSGHPLGLNKSDMLSSLRTLIQMATSIKAELLLIGISQATQGKIAETMVRRQLKDGVKLDIRVLLLGESGSGKTSFLGVLSTGQLDNGNGLARMRLLKNINEISSGKTERVHHIVIGLDSEGKILNHQTQLNFSPECMIEKVVDMSTKLITFIDMGGTKRAHNQMIQIVNSQFPDYALLTLSAVGQIGKSTIEYMKLIQIQRIPFMIGVTHIDLVSENHLIDVIDQIKELIQSLQITSIPVIVRSLEDVVLFSKQIRTNTVIPIFFISNLKSATLEQFIKFLNLLPSTNELINNSNLPSEYCIHNTFEITNQKDGKLVKVLGGTVVKGVIRVNQIIHIGPDRFGSFYPIEIEEIHCNRVQVKSAQCGQICTIKFKKTPLSKVIGEDQNPIRRGMVLIDGKTNPQAAWDFIAEIFLFDDQKETKKISTSFELVVNTQSTRQVCKIIKDEQLLCEPPMLEKKHSKSIDSGSNNSCLQKQQHKSNDNEGQRKSYRKQSEQIKKANSTHDLQYKYESPRRRKGSTQVQFINQEETAKMDLFVITEKTDKIMDFIELQPNQPNMIRLKFKYFPEYLKKGMKIIINEPNLQAWGLIKIINY